MSPQIRNLMQQKEAKIKQLEECDGKRKGWMIAGISTIGLTAVGVGVNIAQASKSNKLSSEIEQSKTELEGHQRELDNVNRQVAAKERAERIARERAACTGKDKQWDDATNQCIKTPSQPSGTVAVEVQPPISSPQLDSEPEIGTNCSVGGVTGTWQKIENPNNNPDVKTCIDETPGASGKVDCICVAPGQNGGASGNSDKPSDKSDGKQSAASPQQQNAQSAAGKSSDVCSIAGLTLDSVLNTQISLTDAEISGACRQDIARLETACKVYSEKCFKGENVHGIPEWKHENNKVWCQITTSGKCGESYGNNPASTSDQDSRQVMELAKYKDYQVKCDGTDERFEFINDIRGADAHISRIQNECNGKLTTKEATVGYTDSFGTTTGHTGTVIICNCTQQQKIKINESGHNEISSREIREPINPDWSTLEKAERPYGVTKEDFCGLVTGRTSTYIEQSLNTHNKNLSALIEYGAGIGYWCKELGGNTAWGVRKESFWPGRVYRCDNLDQIRTACNGENNSNANATSQSDNTPTANSSSVTSVNAGHGTAYDRQRAAHDNCDQSGGSINWLGNCSCSRSKGLKQTDDKKSCECIKGGHQYDKDQDKCVGPDRTKVLEFMDELDANSKERFL